MTRRPLALLVALLPACRHPLAGVGPPGEIGVVLPDAATGDRAPRTDDLTLTIHGHARHLIVHLPGGDATRALPLVFNLHGSGGTASGQQAYTAMDTLADAQGFIAAYPDGAVALGGGFAWNVPGQPLSGGGAVPPDAADDVAFFAQAIAILGQRYAIDGRRIYATGFSGGGRMASQIGCDLSPVVAAVAPVSGLRFPGPCADARAVPVISFHGTADTTNPYEGGGPTYWTYSVPSAAAQWAAHDGCAATPEVTQAAAGVELSAYRGCTAGAEVALYTIAGAGHEWPGAPQQAFTIDASSVMWAFFTAHPLP
ncbi:MAG TPA: PHB depolymerase family esterase [Polyangia bacterium]|jgi:polyhydroxybutyrate depolymerase|nr:PHB depolymerase family esterase [Polyangia bacterium]